MGLPVDVAVGLMGLGLREVAWPDAVLTRALLKGSQRTLTWIPAAMAWPLSRGSHKVAACDVGGRGSIRG